MLSYLFGKTSTPEQAAQAQLQAAFYALTPQKEIVAEKRKAYDLNRLVAEQAKKNMEGSKLLYDTAVSTLGDDSKEAQGLNINHRVRQTEYKQKWQQLADARKELDLAIAELKKRQEKYDQCRGIQAATSTVTNVEQTRQPGRVILPEAVVQHFQGNNREHMNTAQGQAARQELTQTRSGINFSQMHQKLARTLHLTSNKVSSAESTIINEGSSSSSSQRPEIQVSRPTLLPFKAALEEKFRAMNIKQEPDNLLAEEIRTAIQTRRRQWEND